MNILRTPTSTGTIISFDRHRHSDHVAEKNGPIKLSRELKAAMSGASKLLVADPIGRDIQRTWVIGGENFYAKPDKKAITHSDD